MFHSVLRVDQVFAYTQTPSNCVFIILYFLHKGHQSRSDRTTLKYTIQSYQHNKRILQYFTVVLVGHSDRKHINKVRIFFVFPNDLNFKIKMSEQPSTNPPDKNTLLAVVQLLRKYNLKVTPGRPIFFWRLTQNLSLLFIIIPEY